MSAEEQAQRIDQLAKSKLNMKMGVRRELKRLPEKLGEGEEVLNLAGGTVGSKQGLVVVTNERLMFYAAGVVGEHTEEFAYRSISSIEASTSMMSGKLRVYVSGNKAEITSVMPKGAVNEIAEYVRARLGTAASSPPPVAPAGDGAGDRLRKLAALRDEGLISDAEYESKRAEMLADL